MPLRSSRLSYLDTVTILVLPSGIDSKVTDSTKICPAQGSYSKVRTILLGSSICLNSPLKACSLPSSLLTKRHLPPTLKSCLSTVVLSHHLAISSGVVKAFHILSGV